MPPGVSDDRVGDDPDSPGTIRSDDVVEWFTILHRVQQIMAASLDEEDLFADIVEYLATELGYDSVSLVSVDFHERVLRSRAVGTPAGLKEIAFRMPMSQGLIGQAQVEKRTVYAPDVKLASAYQEFNSATRSELVIPLFMGAAVPHLLNIERLQPHAFAPMEITRLETIAGIIAQGLANASLFSMQKRRAQELNVLVELAKISLTSLDADEICSRSAETMVKLGAVEDAGLMLLSEDRTHLRLVTRAGIFGHGQPGEIVPIEEGIVGWVIRNDRHRIVGDAAEDEFFKHVDWIDAHSEMALPLRSTSGVVGVLDMEHSEKNAFSEADVPFFEAAGALIAHGIDTAKSYSREQQLVQELQQRTEDLGKSVAELDQFVHIASHDLTEPLRMVSSFLQLLESRYSDKLDGDAIEYIHYASDGARRMKGLISDLLHFSRVGRLRPPQKQARSEEILDQVLLDLEAQLRGKEVELIRNRIPDLWMHPTALSQLLQNLISNAIKFGPQIGSRIELSAGRQGEFIVFSVTDNGIGIENEYQEKVFAAFERLHSRDRYPGSGIGLAICKKVVEAHGGRIWFESTLGHGTTFHVALPDLLPNEEE